MRRRGSIRRIDRGWLGNRKETWWRRGERRMWLRWRWRSIRRLPFSDGNMPWHTVVDPCPHLGSWIHGTWMVAWSELNVTPWSRSMAWTYHLPSSTHPRILGCATILSTPSPSSRRCHPCTVMAVVRPSPPSHQVHPEPAPVAPDLHVPLGLVSMNTFVNPRWWRSFDRRK